MVLVTKQEFLDWKQNSVTKAFFDAARQRIEEAKEILSYSAGTDSVNDRVLVGMIQAYREMQEFRVEDIEEVE